MVPPVPANGLQVITPIFRDVAAGTEVEGVRLDRRGPARRADVRSTIGYQTDFGHHTIVYYTTQKLPAGTRRVCTDNDMASFRYLAGNPGDGIANVAPGNLVYKIPPGAQIVINHHYLNSGTEAVDGQSLSEPRVRRPRPDSRRRARPRSSTRRSRCRPGCRRSRPRATSIAR
ncbi:MAG: hypothetical protein IPH80_08515 [Myxococcales bacterium]|nr:hypothetical protein [Myxococcales bacterium]